MKKMFTFFASLSCLLIVGISGIRAQSASSVNPTPQFMTDITVEANSLADQRHVHIATAFNGWVFAAYLVNDTTTHKGGVVVRYSKNGGINWMSFNNYPYFDHSMFTNCDLTIVGKDTTSLYVYVGATRKDVTTGNYEVQVLRYNPYHTAYPPVKVYFQQLDMNKVYDLALANDYKNPASGDLDYGLGLLYNHHGPVKDSLIFVTTGLMSASKLGKTTVIATAHHLRYISLAFSSSQTAHKGTYQAAWESLDSANSKFGHVLVSRTLLRTDSVWIKPIYLDSMNTNFTDKLRYPTIASQVNNNDNDSSNATTAVAFEWPRNGNPDSLDIYGYYNKRSDTTNFWNMFLLATSNDQEKQPNMSFDSYNNQFNATYYDSTSGGLVYFTQPTSFTSPNSWNSVNTHYNDNTANLKAPWPKVAVNPLTKQAFMAWVVDPSNGNGIVKCDGQYLFTGIEELDASGVGISNPYPNPSTTLAVIPVQAVKETNLRLTLYTLLGESAGKIQQIHLQEGEQQIVVDVNDLASGVYLCSMESDSFRKTVRLVVQH
jgi:hypothetical protein